MDGCLLSVSSPGGEREGEHGKERAPITIPTSITLGVRASTFEFGDIRIQPKNNGEVGSGWWSPLGHRKDFSIPSISNVMLHVTIHIGEF